MASNSTKTGPLTPTHSEKDRRVELDSSLSRPPILPLDDNQLIAPSTLSLSKSLGGHTQRDTNRFYTIGIEMIRQGDIHNQVLQRKATPKKLGFDPRGKSKLDKKNPIVTSPFACC
ncbi:hypothetical protein V6N13_074929 [Hibiscus sabdariffa]|uniref:Uncharacterized protein n=1 Tax=Hibiscus sabdariffa TaxID=183260 RepID=A0ABR2UAI4_9ROSI